MHNKLTHIKQIKITYSGPGGVAINDHGEHSSCDQLMREAEINRMHGRNVVSMDIIFADMNAVRCSWCGCIIDYKSGLTGESHGVCDWCLSHHPDLQNLTAPPLKLQNQK